MSDSEAYLRELRRALPIWCRRRLLAEVREHFALAVAAEAARGVPTVDAEQMTIRRLGPARALADQLLDDLRSGALGRVGRFAVTLTATRLAAFATVAAIAVVLGVGLGVPRSSSQPPALQRPAVSEGAAAQAPTAKRAIEARARARAAERACREAWTSLVITRIGFRSS